MRLLRPLRICLVPALFCFLALGAARNAAADAERCGADPAVVVFTASGSIVPLHVTSGAPRLLRLPADLLAGISCTVTPADDGKATPVTVSAVPDPLFGPDDAARSTVNTGPPKVGSVLAAAQGRSGEAIRLTFKPGVP
ncbi:MAG TPA: hypothetical protein VHS99_13255 [Chloroflexota bacterium]|jgi:hypothetical protein|nr:hypothetical protein [Chloroflexota bacterium]